MNHGEALLLYGICIPIGFGVAILMNQRDTIPVNGGKWHHGSREFA